MDLVKKELILLRSRHIRIFWCKANNLLTGPRKLHQNYTVKIRRREISCINERLLNLNCITTLDVIRHFICNTEANFDASNGEPLPGAVKAFREYLQGELDAAKKNLEQVKKWAIKKDGYVKLRIEDINGSQINFVLTRVIFENFKLNLLRKRLKLRTNQKDLEIWKRF